MLCMEYLSGLYQPLALAIRQMEYLSVIDELLSIFRMEYSIPISSKNLGDFTAVLIPALYYCRESLNLIVNYMWPL